MSEGNKKRTPGKVSRIGLQNESTIHSQLKEMYHCPGSRTEVQHGAFVVDVDRGDGELVEIQTRRFGLIREKLRFLVESHRVRLVHPLAVRKVIVMRDPATGRESSRRKSPKSLKLIDLSDELVGIAPLLAHPRFTLEVLFTAEEEIRSPDGKGSWRRKGTSILDRRLVRVEGSLRLCAPQDYLRAFLPPDTPEEFTNNSLAERLGVPYRKAQQVTYCLRALGVLDTAGRKGRAIQYRLKESGSGPDRSWRPPH